MASRRLRHRIESPSYAENHAKARPVSHARLRLLEADQDPVGSLRATGGLKKVEQVSYLNSRTQDGSAIANGY